MFRETSSITGFENFFMVLGTKINNFVDVLLKKTAHAQLGCNIRKSRIKLCTVKVVSK